MKRFNQEYKTKLWDTIADIENHSLVEVVVVVRRRAGFYASVPIWLGVALSFIVFTLLMFLPTPFSSAQIYFGPIIAFLIGYVLAYYINPLHRLFLRKKTMQRFVEIMGRALFQKGGIRHTNEKIGVLFFISLFEKTVLILPDRGAETAVPSEEWDEMNARFQTIFEKDNPAKAVIEELQACKPLFNKYIPPIEDDINELPDDLEINL